METSSTYPKFSFLRFFYTLVLVPLLLCSPGLVGDVVGQTKVPATIISSESEVTNATNAVTIDESKAVVRSRIGTLLSPGTYSGELELEFPTTLTAGTTSYLRIDLEDDRILNALLGGSLGNALVGLVDGLLLGSHYFEVEARNSAGATVLSGSSANGFTSSDMRLVRNAEGHYLIAITPNAPYNKIFVKDRLNGALLNLLIPNSGSVDVYYAYYLDGLTDCTPASATSFDGTGITLDLLELGNTGVSNPHFAIDGDASNTFSEINVGLLGVAASMSQYVDFPTPATPFHHFTVKLAINTSETLSAELLGAYEIVAWNGTQEVYKRSLAGGIINGLDALSLLQSGQPATFTFGPSKVFDRIEIRVNALIGLSAASSSVKVYDVQRYGPGCPDPNLPTPTATPGPLEIPSCASEVVAFEHVDFAANATDGNNETYATINASNGTLLVASPVAGYIEMELPEVLPANKTSYVRIDVEDDILDRLVNGSIGQLLSGVGGLVLGDHYFTVEAKLTEGGASVLSGSSANTFDATTGGVVTIVQDKIGRYYIAITPNSAYQYVRITDHVAGLGTGVQKSMKVYNLCYETSDNTCFPAFATSADGSGLTAGILDNGAGVKNADNAISDNSSDYSEISLGTAAVAAEVNQTIYFNGPSTVGDELKVRVQVGAPSLLDVNALGRYKIQTYLGSQLVDDFTLQQGLVAGLNVLNIFEAGGIVTLSYVPTGAYDRVVVGLNSLLSAGLTPPLRLYSVKRIGADCPPDPATLSPFENPTCASDLIDASNADDIQHLFDDDFDSYATLNSGAGSLLGIGQFEGFVEMGFAGTVPANTTSYVRIDFEPTLLNGLLGGSLGGTLAGIVDGLLLGNHYFSVDVKNGAGTSVLSGASNNGFGSNTDRIRIVQDNLGRYYIALTPGQAYKTIRITDHTNAAVGLLAQPNTMNVYGVCFDTPTSACPPAFATSFDGSGLTLDAGGLSGVGVTNAAHAIDGNTTNYSEISLGTAGVGATVKQYIFFNKLADADDQVDVTISFGTGAVDLSLIGNIELKAYNGLTEVAELDWQSGIVNGVNVVDLLNNGGVATVPFVPGVPFDRISVGINALVAASALPPLRLYEVAKVCDIAAPQFESWKSYVLPGTQTAVSGGEEVTYTIHIRNTGTTDLNGFIVTDEIPAHTTYVAASGGTEVAGVVTFDNINIAAGATGTVSFKVTVDNDLTGVTEIGNVATVKANPTDPGTETVPPADNDDPTAGPDPTATPGTPTRIPVDPISSLVSWKSYVVNGDASIDAVGGGESVAYTVFVRNTGNQRLTNVTITDAVPLGTTYASGGTFAGGAVSFTIPSIEVGATAAGRTFYVTVDEDLTGVDVIHNLATVGATGVPPTGSYPPVDNDTPTDPDTGGGTGTDIPVTPLHDIDFTKTGFSNNAESTGKAVVGDIITYTLTITNTGNKALTNIAVVDAVPSNLTIIDNGGGTVTGSDLEFAIASLAVGATQPFTFTAEVMTVDPSSPPIDNEATATYRNEDNTGDKTETAVYRIQTDCTLAIATDIVVADAEVCEGSAVTLTASAPGVTDPIFNWYADAALTNLIFTGPALSINPVEAGTFYVTVIGEGVCENMPGTAKEVTVTVNPAPEVILTDPASYSIEIGGTVAVPGYNALPGVSYEWVDQTGATVTSFGPFDAAGTYTYTLIATDDVTSCQTAVTVVVNVYNPGDCPPVFSRVYNDAANNGTVASLLGLVTLGNVQSPQAAASSDVTTYSTISEVLATSLLGLTGETSQTLTWNSDIPAGTPVTVKLAKEYGVAGVIGGIYVQAVDASGNDVGSRQWVDPNLASVVNGVNVFEYTFAPTQDYRGVRVALSSVLSAAQSARIYHAYYHESGTPDCAEPNGVIDVLGGMEFPIGVLNLVTGLTGVSDPWDAVDEDETSYATLTNTVGANAYSKLEVVYGTPALMGDTVTIKVGKPGTLLNVGLLDNFTIQPYLGSAAVGAPIHNDPALLKINLLPGEEEATVQFIANAPFDRIKILYGGVASVLDQLRVFEITRKIPTPIVGPNADNTFEICPGGDIVIPDPDDCTSYILYTTVDGTVVADVPSLPSGTHTLYLQTIRFGSCEVGERTPITVIVKDALPPALTELEQVFCEIDAPTVANLNEDGATGDVRWYSASTGGTPLSPGDALVTGLYYASQITDGCESIIRTEVMVTVTATPPPALTQLEQVFCEIDAPTVASLNTAGAAGIVVWYDAMSGGTPLDPTTALVDGTYYAAQVGDNCESVLRTEVTVTITKTPPPALTELEQVFCEIDAAAVADLNDDGATGTVIWYTAATGGTPLLPTEALVDGTYYAAQIGASCESVLRTAVEVTITKTPPPALTELEQVFCEIDAATVADLNDDGATGTVIWYTAATGGTPLLPTAALVDGTYYAAQVGDNCESVLRTEVTVTITKTPPPALTELEQVFCEIDAATVADLNDDGATGTVIWYTAATGGTALLPTAALVDGTYYAAQVGDNCESVLRTAVEVTITKTPPPALTELEQVFCEIDAAAVADLNEDGATGTVIWYTAATGGTALLPTAALVNGTYYAAQVGDNCESVARTAVDVTITKTPPPALTELEQVFCEIDAATVADLNEDGATGTVIWYTAATGGTALLPTAALVDGTYYAAQVGDNCESVSRTAVEVTITKTPPPALTELEQVFCEIDAATVADLNDDGATGTVIWYTAATGGTPLLPTAALVDGTYYAAQVGDNCESVLRTAVEVTITKTPPPALTELEQVFCEIDAATVADLNEDGATGTVIWYTAATGGTPLAPTTALVDGTYYAAQVGDNCESIARTAVEVTITVTPAPTIDNNAPEFCETDNRTLADLDVIGTAIKWYASATSTDVLPETTVLEDGVTYYATQTGDNCESVERLAVTPVINDCTSLLSITKTADADRATAGEPITFTVTITNEGPGAMHSGDVIKLGERPSPGLTITDYEVTSGNATANGSGNAATVTTNTTIPVGGTIALTVTADVDADAPATVNNGIDVWGPDKDPENDPKDDDDDTPPIPVDRKSNLSITKVADEARVKAGESTSFTLTITNNGPSVIEVGKDINLTERPGDGVTITGYEVTSGAATVIDNGNTAVLTTTGKITVGATIVVKVTADIAANAGETITNGITVWGPDKDPDTDPEDDEDDTPPIPVDRDAVLGITKVADQARVRAGESTTFTLTITNNGPAVVASGEVISLTERPGAGVTITGYEVTSGNGTANGSGNTATVTTSAAIAVGGTIVVKVTADIAANAGETITNGIDVWGPDKDPDTDPRDDDDDTPPIPVDHVSVLSVTKVANDERVITGGTTSFTVTVTNNGPATIAVGETIAVEERPSNGITITGYAVTSGNATVDGTGNTPQLTTTAAIGVGATIAFTVSADVTAPAGATISNGIAVWGPDKDPGTDDEDDEDETPEIPVDRPYTLSIEKVADQSLVTAGESTTFTVNVTNNGPLAIEAGKVIPLRERPGTGVTITGYEIISGAATVSGTGNTATLTTTGVVGVGATISVRITATVAETATGTITNGITVWGPDNNPDTDDPDDEDDTGPIPVDATLHIPNVFTPNGDGLNDRFVIKNLLQYQGRELTVVNRWGNQVYKSDNYNNDWDGGSLAEGTYYYILRYRNGGEWKTAKGPVAIIRVTNR